MRGLNPFTKAKANLSHHPHGGPIAAHFFRSTTFFLIFTLIFTGVIPHLADANQARHWEASDSTSQLTDPVSSASSATRRVVAPEEKAENAEFAPATRQSSRSKAARVWAGTSDAGVWLFANAQWMQRSSGLGNVQVHSLQINPFDRNVLIAVTPQGVFRTEDAGDNWILLTMPFTQAGWNDVYWDRASSGDVVISGPEMGEVYNADPVAAVSHDGGFSWQGINLDIADGEVGQAFPGDVWGFNGVWYITGDSGLKLAFRECTRRAIWRSVNHGDSWELLCSFPDRWYTAKYLTGLWINPFHLFGTFVHLVGNPIAESLDGGETWGIGDQFFPDQGPILADPVRDGALWLLAQKNLHRSSSGASGFEFVYGGGLKSVAIDADNGFIFAGGSNRHMAYSQDDGASWIRADLPRFGPITDKTAILSLAAEMPALPSHVATPIVLESDDAGPEAGGCTFSVSHPEIYFGQCDRGEDIISGFRFSRVPISHPEQIESAFIEITVDGPYENDLHIQFLGEAVANAATFREQSKPSDRINLTSLTIDWALSAAEKWNSGERWRSPDLTPILREIVARPDWEKGNAISIIVKNVNSTGHRRVFALERSKSGAARLIINQPANALVIQDVEPERLIVETTGVERTFTITVVDANGYPVEGANISGYDALRGRSYSTLPDGVTGPDGKVTYTTEIPMGIRGVYEVTFIAAKPGYSTSAEVTREVWVGELPPDLKGSIVIKPNSLNMVWGSHREIELELTSPAFSRGVTIDLLIDDPSVIGLDHYKVYIPKGETRSAYPIQVLSLKTGAATITARAPGYTPGTCAVNVYLGDVEYVLAKQDVINYFRNEDIYYLSELRAFKYSENMRIKIQRGEATEKDVEALQRLLLIEIAAKSAYAEPHGANIKAITLEMGDAFEDIVLIFILDVVLDNIMSILESLKGLPVIGPAVAPFYEFGTSASRKLTEIFSTILRGSAVSVEQLAVEHAISQGWSRDMIDQLIESNVRENIRQTSEAYASYTIDEIAERIAENALSFKEEMARHFLNIYESGFAIPAIGNLPILKGTEIILTNSLIAAENQALSEKNLIAILDETTIAVQDMERFNK